MLNLTDTKKCYGCKQILPRTVEVFGRARCRKDGLKQYCKVCSNAMSSTPKAKALHKKAFRRRMSDPAYAERRSQKDREARLKCVYGLTLSQYDEILVSQGGCCAICKDVFPKNKKLRVCVDHDHATGKVRGLLCFCCNHGMHFIDREGWVDEAMKYREGWTNG